MLIFIPFFLNNLPVGYIPYTIDKMGIKLKMQNSGHFYFMLIEKLVALSL
jgi:hypothetical protein